MKFDPEDEALMEKITEELFDLQLDGGDSLTWLAGDKQNSGSTVEKIDAYLRQFDIEKLGILSLLGLLRTAVSSRHQVPYWYEMRDKAMEKLERENFPDWKNILHGLKPGDYGMEK